MSAGAGTGDDARRVLVFGSAGDERVAEQLARLQTDSVEAEDRDVAVVEVATEPEAGELAASFGLEPEEFAVVLIGRDGTEKERWTEEVAPEELWDAVDDMPMRRAEMAEEGGDTGP